MACFNMVGLHAVARIPASTARSRRPFETTRVSLDNAREPFALAGFFSRRVKPHALQHTEHSMWMDQTRRHGRALRDTRTPRRWATAPSNESIPAEGEAARHAYVPRSEYPKAVNAERWIKKGVALVCSECETTETSQWYANRDDKDKPVCKLAASRGKCSGCSKDGANTSEMRRSKPKKHTWYCMQCSYKEELDIETAAGTKCVDCGTDATTQWFDCKDESGNKMCRPCSNKNRLDVAAVAGTTCVKCGTDTTSDWINCKETPGTKICRACHSKNARNKKAAMAKEK